MKMVAEGIEKKCDANSIAELERLHGKSSWDAEKFQWIHEAESKPEGQEVGHWDPEKMRKWFCMAWKKEPEVVLGFVAYMVRPMQSSGAWCKGAGYCGNTEKDHEVWMKAIEHADKKNAIINERSDIVATYSSDAQHQGEHAPVSETVTDPTWTTHVPLHFIEPQVHSEFVQQLTDGAMESEHEEPWMSSHEHDSKQEAQKQQEDTKKKEESGFRRMISRRLEEVPTFFNVFPRRLSVFTPSSPEYSEWNRGEYHSWIDHKGRKIGCPGFKMCMMRTMGHVMKWAVMKTKEWCMKTDSERAQKMCKWAGEHPKFAFGAMIGHVEPWKFAMGHCIRKHDGHGHGHHGHGHHHDGPPPHHRLMRALFGAADNWTNHQAPQVQGFIRPFLRPLHFFTMGFPG